MPSESRRGYFVLFVFRVSQSRHVPNDDTFSVLQNQGFEEALQFW